MTSRAPSLNRPYGACSDEAETLGERRAGKDPSAPSENRFARAVPGTLEAAGVFGVDFCHDDTGIASSL